jgi:hypothetical protein
MKKYSAVVTCMFISLITIPLFAEGSLSLGFGGFMDTRDNSIAVQPETGCTAAFDLFLPVTETFSVFSLSGGLLNYRIVDNEWRYFYDCSLDISYRDDKVLIKPSIHVEGELLYTTILDLPDIWENSAAILLSLETGESSFYCIPEFSWENDNFFVKGEIGSSYAFFTRYIVTLLVSGGITFLESRDDEKFICPEVKLSWYPDIPFILSTSFAFIWYDSDYMTDLSESALNVEILDFYEVSGTFECSTFFAEIFALDLALPFSMSWKHHGALVNNELDSEEEWVFTVIPEANLTIFFTHHHRCTITITGEKAFSNSRYQETGNVSLDVSYELFF